jgi:hypothetical protein
VSKRNRPWKQPKNTDKKHHLRVKQLRAEAKERNEGIETASPEEQVEMLAQAEQPAEAMDKTPVLVKVSTQRPMCPLCRHAITELDLSRNATTVTLNGHRFLVHRTCPVSTQADLSPSGTVG